ncbi:MAG: metal ABC transporter ATP-binding protein [Acidimicrobiia bacterium]|nr:metal ABC transporter ATP-binding protein [Acidimicrobiia bacterium]MBT8217174.1 metal ABC transporter ATP-binding protein [Acidimicrobiia bacterium]NNF10103.1 metal ABC transporter ATP-binding protein [Acidimicrobiia bacterium]NNL68617.1 metal ABC transporter ATP-binding protein [Acidimicrobiia bacterium]
MPMTGVAVTARDLVLGYGASVALERSSFELPAGKVIAVIGPNGSGKSTVLNAIAGLIEPMAGTIEVPARRTGSHRISYVLQTTKVNDSLPISVREVVTMGRYASAGGLRRLEAADRAAVRTAMDRTGITPIAGTRLQNLSGGQRQRVFVAQGLAQDHDLLLLDEPLTGIDLPTAQAIDEVIHDEISRGCTVILTTHDLSEARVADHVLLLSGRAIASGTPAEVLTDEHLVTAYGPSLLHVESGAVFLDDPAHQPVPGRHLHRERSMDPDAERHEDG